MHSAPSVTYPVGRSRVAGLLYLWAWLGGAGVIVLWAGQAADAGWRQGLAVTVLAITGAVAAWSWRSSPVGELGWDGDAWHWRANGQDASGCLAASLDFQQFILLRWDGGPGTHWFWVERVSLPQRWDDLRRALYFPARSAARRQAGSAPTNP